MDYSTSIPSNAPLRQRAPKSLPLAAASADQRGFLVIYERPGYRLNLAEVYELAGMAVVG